jgi:hypothetical protein
MRPAPPCKRKREKKGRDSLFELEPGAKRLALTHWAGFMVLKGRGRAGKARQQWLSRKVVGRADQRRSRRAEG